MIPEYTQEANGGSDWGMDLTPQKGELTGPQNWVKKAFEQTILQGRSEETDKTLERK